jgi:biotin-(acetyl-CoA carboxylase) ligase
MSTTLDLPPGYEAIALRERGDAFAHAVERAAECGAGTLVWVGRFDTAEVAIVLEPEEPLAAARPVHYALMNAVADALGVHMPPEKPVAFGWPDTILLDGGVVGGVRTAWPQGAAETRPPDWLVVAATVRLAFPQAAGTRLGDVRTRRGTGLDLEGVAFIDAAGLVGGIARHFMVQLDHWREEGFQRIGVDFLGRLPRPEDDVRRGIDVDGTLIERSSAGDTRSPLASALASPGWLDPATGEPWL